MESIRILCYGDSNTWGWIPLTGERYISDIRWTGVLQNLLGKNYVIIEEGLGARMTVHDDPRPGFIGRNGLTYLIPCLESQKPLDLVIMMLGTPDLKGMMGLSAQKIADGIKILVKTILESKSGINGSSPKILLISPAVIDETTDFASKFFLVGGTEKSKKLEGLYSNISKESGCDFLSAGELKVGADGIHLTKESHLKLANMLFEIINGIRL